MKPKYAWLIFGSWTLLWTGLVAGALAQEKPARPTRSWQAYELPQTKSGFDFQKIRVDVIDTEGVCLYVARSYIDQGGAAIAAVPKTQLPAGVGCQ